MSAFKDDLKEDLNVFVESEEFAEFVTLDGVVIRAQLLTNTDERSKDKALNFDKLHGDFATLYFKAADYCGKKARIPIHDEQVWLNGKCYKVLTSKDELGIAKLELAAYRQTPLRPSPYRGANPYEA